MGHHRKGILMLQNQVIGRAGGMRARAIGSKPVRTMLTPMIMGMIGVFPGLVRTMHGRTFKQDQVGRPLGRRLGHMENAWTTPRMLAHRINGRRPSARNADD